MQSLQDVHDMGFKLHIWESGTVENLMKAMPPGTAGHRLYKEAVANGQMINNMDQILNLLESRDGNG